jgi:Protein of unknown function (DUF2637)
MNEENPLPTPPPLVSRQQKRAQMKNNMPRTKEDLLKSDRTIHNVASATTIVIAACAALLSYSALRELAIDSAINPILAYLFPLTLDGLILVGALMVLFSASRGERSWGGFFLTGLGVVSSIAGNVAVSPNTLTARLVHAAAPIVLFLAIEAVTSLRRKRYNDMVIRIAEFDEEAATALSVTPSVKTSTPLAPVSMVPATEDANPRNSYQVPLVESPLKDPLATTSPAPRRLDTSTQEMVSSVATNDTGVSMEHSGPKEASLQDSQAEQVKASPKKPSESPQNSEKPPTIRDQITALVEGNPSITLGEIQDAVPGDKKYIRKIAKQMLGL